VISFHANIADLVIFLTTGWTVLLPLSLLLVAVAAQGLSAPHSGFGVIEEIVGAIEGWHR
jgi:hypothetical protein